MLRKLVLRAALISAAALGLGACSTGYGYGGGFGGGGVRYSNAYDGFYGDPFGYQSVPYGYAGSGFGWAGDYYYPGNGAFVYDRGGHRRLWSGGQQRYWQQQYWQHQYWQQQGRPGGFYGQGRPGYGRPNYGRPYYGQPGFGRSGRGRPDAVSAGIGAGLAGVPRQQAYARNDRQADRAMQRQQRADGQPRGQRWGEQRMERPR